MAEATLTIALTVDLATDPETVQQAADALKANTVQPIGLALADALSGIVCPTCRGHKLVYGVVDNIPGTAVDCPVCSGNGWLDGVNPLVEVGS